ncbi:MAG: hypothetical protein KAF91_08575 [Nostoc sp. TH1S01]|nr:hypothetical protein [Nostoc sp. TH1S01]
MTQKKSQTKANVFNQIKATEAGETKLSELVKKQTLSGASPESARSDAEYFS